MDKYHIPAFKALKRLAATLLLTFLLAVICLAVAPTFGYAQEPGPNRHCVDFSDWEEGEFKAEFIKDGFVFTALNEEPQFIYLTDTPQVLGLLVSEIGVNISFPQTTSQVTLSTVSYASSPLEITALNPEGIAVAEDIAPSFPQDTIHTVSLIGRDIVRLVIRGGGNESFLVEICIEIEAEEEAEGPFIEVVDPPEGQCGSEVQLSVFGANFEQGSSVFIPEGIETLYTEFISPEELTAVIFIAEDAPTGVRPVIVSGPELGEAILEGGFSVIGPPPPGGPGLLPPIIGGVALVLVGTLSIRQVIKIRRRKSWQEKAEEEESQEPCEPDAQHCQCKEIKCELAQSQIKHIMLEAYDAVSGEPSKERQVEGEIVDGFNRVIAASRHGENPEKLAAQIAPLAHALLQQIVEWLRPKPTLRDVSVIGHLEGCKVKYKFIRKRCKETRTWGKAEEEWEATIKEARDESLAVLPNLDPTKPGMPEQLTTELTGQIMRFIEKV